MFHFFPYVNIVFNILLCSPFFICNNNIYCTIQAHNHEKAPLLPYAGIFRRLQGWLLRRGQTPPIPKRTTVGDRRVLNSKCPKRLASFGYSTLASEEKASKK